jgi:hypothetical protein
MHTDKPNEVQYDVGGGGGEFAGVFCLPCVGRSLEILVCAANDNIKANVSIILIKKIKAQLLPHAAMLASLIIT